MKTANRIANRITNSLLAVDSEKTLQRPQEFQHQHPLHPNHVAIAVVSTALLVIIGLMPFLREAWFGQSLAITGWLGLGAAFFLVVSSAWGNHVSDIEFKKYRVAMARSRND